MRDNHTVENTLYVHFMNGKCSSFDENEDGKLGVNDIIDEGKPGFYIHHMGGHTIIHKDRIRKIEMVSVERTQTVSNIYSVADNSELICEFIKDRKKAGDQDDWAKLDTIKMVSTSFDINIGKAKRFVNKYWDD